MGNEWAVGEKDWYFAAGLASGVYLYRMQAGGFVQVRRLCLVR